MLRVLLLLLIILPLIRLRSHQVRPTLDFSGIASSTTDDIKAYLDWTKFKWILDEQDSGGTAITFNGSGVTTPDSNYVTSALITGDTTMEITLATAGAALLEGNAKFGNLGGTGAFGKGTDAVRIEEGFIKDKSETQRTLMVLQTLIITRL